MVVFTNTEKKGGPARQVTQGSSTTESYTYDLVGNRLSSLGASPYSYNSSNELTSTPSATYTYDYNGNTKTKVDSSGTTTYNWDSENRLTSVVLPASGGTVYFKYDPFGRRVQKSGPSGTVNYLYDGANILEEVNGSGTVLAKYAQGASVDEPLSQSRSSTLSFYEQDGLGSVTSLSNASGALANTYTYDSYGQLGASTGSAVNPFQYTGREFDSDTQFYFYRARYYDGGVGRFLSEDPLEQGNLGRLLSLFAYVENNPANYTDPLGLYGIKPGIPAPSAPLDALLKCIEAKSGVPLYVTSTSEPPPLSPHDANDPHRRNGGLAVDVSYPSDPGAVLSAAACCGAKNGLDEKIHPSKNATGPHLHIQLVPGPNPGNPGGDLPKHSKCKDCQ